MIIIT